MSDWRPGASRAALAARACLFAELRQFFAQRGVLEVDTPLLCSFGVSDPSIEPLTVALSVASSAPRFLQSSPEYAMKRLLAAGSGPIYQLGKAFRDAEIGPRHNPEFTLLEWYRPDFSLDALIDELGELLQLCLGRQQAPRRFDYRDLFLDILNVDPWETEAAELAAVARSRLDCGDMQLDRDGWLDLLMSHTVEPELAACGLAVILDYPPSQAALARRVYRGDREVGERFELYVDGVELANGYRELLDANELVYRAEADNTKRRGAGQEQRILDPRLIAAMRSGLPDCSGVALGVDRLLMLCEAESTIAAVTPFDWTRC